MSRLYWQRICVCVADSVCCSAETNNIVKQPRTQKKQLYLLLHLYTYFAIILFILISAITVKNNLWDFDWGCFESIDYFVENWPWSTE